MSETLGYTPDEIGPWSEIKLEIVRDYAAAYSRILSAQRGLRHIYIDAFAGGGTHISRTTGEFVPGSPVNALLVKPPFTEYHFIDLEAKKASELRAIKGRRKDVYVYDKDCNEVLLSSVFPRARYEDYRRALCLLDPYGMHLDWKVIETAGRMGSIDMFLNLPIMDMNMNALHHDPLSVDPREAQRMDMLWGDRSWRETCYQSQGDLFRGEVPVKKSNSEVAEVFRKRLCEKAGFSRVPRPVAMRNTKGSIVYYLFLASQKLVARDIISHIFGKYRGRRED
ncbi:MAG: three-Cys-motif partner protein TcmP [Verrucomicrobia bacterium]|nr:three-Cys-motif partner protein TcmP [Verrucomicrobiota bacterium]